MDAERNGPGALNRQSAQDVQSVQSVKNAQKPQAAQASDPSGFRHRQSNTQALHGDTSWQA
uniref:Uncharacterized protein n=1 Tax=Burkholderia sp. (strain CCGE1003) TaxID=640512 RepID=E1T863_BURSG